MPENNKKLAVITTHTLPAVGYGGPAVSLSVLIREWARKGQNILLCSSDASTDGVLKAKDVQFGANVKVSLYHSYWFKRWAFGLGAIPAIYEACKKADAVYINGNATWPMTIAPIMCCALHKPYMVALRGGLMPEHVDMIRKHKYHKWLYYLWLSFPFLRKANTIHCTTPIEADAARKLLGNTVNTIIVPNGIDADQIKLMPMPQKDALAISYVGRISQEKGINGFIKAWLKCKGNHDRIVVAGSGTGAYFEEFKQLVELSEGSIVYKGYIDASGVKEVVAQSHFLILPSGIERADVRENFGNSVAEALALGRPVLVTRGLSWDHIENEGIGLLFDRNDDSVCRAINIARDMESSQLRQMSVAAYHYAKTHLEASGLANKLLMILRGHGDVLK